MATKAKAKPDANRAGEPSEYAIVSYGLLEKCWAKALADVSGASGFNVAADKLDVVAGTFDKEDLAELCNMRRLTIAEYAELMKSE